jgi:PKHD-type hydroxylase
MEINTSIWYLRNKQLERWAFVNEAFSEMECELIKSMGNQLDLTDASIGHSTDSKRLDKNVRSSKVGWLNSQDPTHEWVFQKCTDLVEHVNSKFWNFDLEYISNLQFGVYGPTGDHYDLHIDSLYSSPHYRKLSFSVLLDDPDSFTGGDLEVVESGNPVNTNIKLGSIVFFPSFIMHGVTPVTQGTRHSLVGWVCGPRFK